MNIRPVTLEDAPQIAEIYNYYIINTHHTFETEPLSVEETEERIKKVTANYPYLVAEEEGEILGYAHAGRFKLRQAYEHSCEVIIYVKNEAKKRGVGSSLYMDLFDLLEQTDIHVMIAGIALPNDSSVKFHERLGFVKAAHFKEIGYKLGRWFDVGYWQLINRV
ncbi:MAG: GNAT family N-acetyltransferase [Pyrinomonadaceae bacterium]|nr:GNAT family N-acetyltransferase [Pyrinomonadaceae bacterium]